MMEPSKIFYVLSDIYTKFLFFRFYCQDLFLKKKYEILKVQQADNMALTFPNCE